MWIFFSLCFTPNCGIEFCNISAVEESCILLSEELTCIQKQFYKAVNGSKLVLTNEDFLFCI